MAAGGWYLTPFPLIEHDSPLPPSLSHTHTHSCAYIFARTLARSPLARSLFRAFALYFGLSLLNDPSCTCQHTREIPPKRLFCLKLTSIPQSTFFLEKTAVRLLALMQRLDSTTTKEVRVGERGVTECFKASSRNPVQVSHFGPFSST